ncbi:NAD-dependent epimerase/dehydratase family protein [Microbacterium sp. cx-55]|uniref:NAD-dependent epimerase/dehydratase family protein n=1 Tax=Microbacterium sp. cx-55 TaxID=2875948 RepID=UPI001CBCA49F|nr:NAD-dependent epimerase/dehydratase family protein [Microbacterium sp. cx-55]MBZ4487091.1 NAD-dependent epimerase/dehydratase family protein [Microbacterium sp. cx-55]UGB36004.1 NAD-dependent epimerase/dehydratase family protein [Microbacterium sp. cx-55]
MPTPHRWIIGRGLLGSAIDRTGSAEAFHVAVDWADSAATLTSLTEGLDEFLRKVRSAAEPWEIYWSAGRGVTSTPRDVVMAEADLFEQFLSVVAERTSEADSGVFFLGSSVGGAYAGSDRPPFSEATAPAPLSAYGEAKLRMEASLRSFVDGTAHRAFIARVTNLYGPGQDLGKGQGLISVMVDGYVTGRPVKVYVSLDTLRDYIYVDDCARVISAAMDRVSREPEGTVVTKIVGSMTALSIGAIVGELSRLRRKPVPLILGQGNATGQALDLRVRSTVWRDLDGLVATTLPAGLGAVYQAQLRSHMLSGL